MLTQEKNKELVTELMKMGYEAQDIQAIQNLVIQSHKSSDASKFVLSEEILGNAARLSKRHFDALVTAGFTEAQAILCVAHAPYRLLGQPQITGVQGGGPRG